MGNIWNQSVRMIPARTKGMVFMSFVAWIVTNVPQMKRRTIGKNLLGTRKKIQTPAQRQNVRTILSRTRKMVFINFRPRTVTDMPQMKRR